MFSCHSWQCVFSCCCHLLKLLAKSLTILYCTEYAHVTTVHSLVLYTVEAASHFPLKNASCEYHHWIRLLFVTTITGSNCCFWIPPLDSITVCEYHHWIQLVETIFSSWDAWNGTWENVPDQYQQSHLQIFSELQWSDFVGVVSIDYIQLGFCSSQVITSGMLQLPSFRFIEYLFYYL